MVDVPLKVAVVGKPGSAIGYPTTNAQGQVTLDLPNVTDQPRIEVWVAVGPRERSATDEDHRDRLATAKTLSTNFTFRERYVVPIVATQSAYVLEIDVQPAMKASMRLLNGITGHPMVHVLKKGTSTLAYRYTDSEGRVTIGGLDRNQPHVLEAWKLDRSSVPTEHLGAQIIRIAVPASATDTDLGEIQVPQLVYVADATVTLQRTADLPTPMNERLDGVTLISADGQTVLSWFFQLHERLEDGTTRDKPGAPEPTTLRIPAGTWYIAPGQYKWAPWQTRLRERCAAGEDLSGTEIPRVTVVAGSAVSIELNAAKAERKILGLPEPTPPPNP